MPSKDCSLNYYEQFCHLSIANIVMQLQIKKLLADRQEMIQRIQKLNIQKREEEGKVRDDESASSSAAIPLSLSGTSVQQKQVALIFFVSCYRNDTEGQPTKSKDIIGAPQMFAANLMVLKVP